jgi:acetyltransferase-like isoleucine patch superfamily enzyme
MEQGIQIHPTAEVAGDAVIGMGTRVWHHAQIREGVRIGRDCILSKGVYVDVGVIIGDRVKIQNGVSVYRGVHIGDDVLVGPYATFTNDPYPRAFPADWEVVPTYLRNGCSIGANATIVCGVIIGEYSLIASGAVVTEDTLPYSVMLGNPARLKSFACICGRELRKIEGEPMGLTLRCARCGRTLSIRFEMHEAAGPTPGSAAERAGKKSLRPDA